ncbi:MAG: Gfo/Idh/MocA family oxidoreductase [Planctomycetota bacterium]
MDLTPEEKAVGKENFQAAIGSPLLRREFLQEGTRQDIASGRGLGAYYFGYDKTLAEPIRVGFLGTGDEGNVLIGAINPEFIQVTAIADLRPYSVYRAFHGDYYSDKALEARCGLMAKYGWKTEDEARRHVKVYGDYRELLENEKDLDAVVIALPLHLHAPAAIAAMRAGKHVLTEKLMAHSVHECKHMARVAQETSLHLATGHQRHYSILYDNAVQAIAAGLLGDLHYIRAQWHRGNLPGTDSWQQPMPNKAKPGDLQADRLDKELASWQKKLAELKEADTDASEIRAWEAKVAQKLAQISDELIAEKAEQFGYQHELIEGVYDRPAIEELIRWRLWDRTGGGLMAELGSHQLDAASIFISAMHGGKKQYPLCVAAAANRPLFPVDREVADHVYCLFEFPAPDYDPNDEHRRRKKISVAYASINGNGFGGYGETVFGTEGTMLLEREQDAMLYKTASTTGKIALAKGPKIELADKGDPLSAAIGTQALAVTERGYTEQLEHWAWCIRTNPNNSDPELQPHCHPKVALADAVIALVSNVAAREGRRVDFKPEWFDPASDETPEGVKPGTAQVA